MIKIIGILAFCFLSVSSNNECKHTYLSTSGVTEEDKKIIVDTHNELRNTIATGNAPNKQGGPNQPQASNMLKMVYDDQLAAEAQQLANKCVFAHSPVRQIAGLGDFGQNVAYNTYDTKSFAEAIKYWYSEVVTAGYPPAGCATTSNGLNACPNDDNGHYLQIAWAETNRVGCGYAHYEEAGVKKHLYVCDYFPAGNLPGGTVYLFGAPASNCPASTSKDSQYPGLCSAASG